MEKISDLLSKNLKIAISKARDSYQKAKKKVVRVVDFKEPLMLILFDTKQTMEVFWFLSHTQTPLNEWAEAYLDVTGNQPSELYFKTPYTVRRDGHDLCPDRVWEDGIRGLETCKVCFGTGQAFLLDREEVIYNKDTELFGKYRLRECWCGVAPKE